MYKLGNATQAADYELPVSVDGQPIALRDVSDPIASRNALYDNVIKTLSSLPPTESKTHRLRLENVTFVDPDEDEDDEEEQRAMDTRTTLGRRVKGTWVLESKADGAEIDRREQVLGVVPKITTSGALIFNGSKYAIGTQHRIDPGFFARRKKSGELESLANVARGTGARHRYLMDPATGLFSFNVANSKIPISNVLEILGATKDDMAAAWGEELADVNWAKRDPKAVQKLFEKLAPRNAEGVVQDEEGKKLAIKQAFEKMLTDRTVNQRTIGLDTDKVDKNSILAATKRILELSRGNAVADDRDHAAFQSYYGPEDVFAERIKLDAGKIRRDLLYKAQRTNSLKSFNSRPIDRQFQSALLDSGLAQLVDAPNPLDLIDRMTRITVYGEGGIGSQDSTPDSTRQVNHSYAGFVDPFRTVESGKVGADTFLASGVKKGSDGQIYTPVVDMRSGKPRYVSAKDMYDKVVTETFKPDLGDFHIGYKNGKIDYFKPEEIDYVIEDPETSYNNLSNLVPGKSAMVPHRPGMATRMLAQSVELVGREAPLLQNGVRNGVPGKDSYDVLYGPKLGAKFAPDKPGTVISVTPKQIEYLTADGTKGRIKLATESVLGRKSRLHNTPLVKPGDKFEPGQLLASSNFTDDKGVAALGVNLRVADMSFPDAYEDAYVVSESAAKNKLASVAMYQHRVEADPLVSRGLNSFVSVFGGKFQPDQLKKVGADGVVKVGQRVSKGDPLVLAMEKMHAAERVHRKGRDSFKDVSLLWDHDDDGEVVGVYQDKSGNTNVRVKTVNPLKDGDKIAMRNGLKGIVVIKPDSEMPRTKDGIPFEAIAPRLGVISRKNPIVKAEIALAKIARKRGEAYRIPDFGAVDDLRDYVRDELAKYQVEEKEDIIDPSTGKVIPKILTGEVYFTKLHHYAESKVQGRATGRYTIDDAPAKGGDELGKSKRIGLLAQHALLAGGGHEFVRGTGIVRGQSNSEFWQAFMSGDTPPEPKVPERYKKFMNLLKVAGVNPLRRGTLTTLTPMTDAEVIKLAGNRVVRSGETIDLYKDQKPIPGGLMDPKIFGDGNQPARMILSDTLPNPAYEEAIKRLLNLKGQEYRDLIAGKHEIPGYGKGLPGLIKYFKSFDVDKELAKTREEVKGPLKTRRDIAVRRLGFLKAMQNLDIKPMDLMRTEVFVLPPRMRPVAVVGAGKKQVPLVNDLNYLYRELFDADDNLKNLKAQLGDDNVGDERLAVYDAMSALSGQIESPNPELKQKGVKGALRMLLPGGPKESYVQRKLVGNTADASGRGVVRPNHRLSMDEVGLPKPMAWDMFANHIVRDLVRRGMPVLQAREAVVNKAKIAEEALVRVMDKTPVLVTRDPALHQFNTIGQWPKLVDGNSININPLIVKGMNMDFDGDSQIGKVILAISNNELRKTSELSHKKILASDSGTATLEEVTVKRFPKLCEIPRASLIRAGLPVRYGAKLFICDLEDFPRLAKERSSEGQFGHIDWYGVPDGMEVLAIDPLTQQVEWAKVTDFSVHHGCPIEIVTLRSGRQIFTDDDPRGLIACIPSLGLGTRSCSPTEAEKLGGLIPRAQRYGINHFKPNVRKLVVAEYCQSRRGSCVLPDEIQLDRGFGWLVGAVCGDRGVETVNTKGIDQVPADGSEERRRYRTVSVCLSNADRGVKKRFDRIIQTLLGDSHRVGQARKHIGKRDREGDGTRANSYGEPQTMACRNVGLERLICSLIGTKSTGKHLPAVFLSSPAAFRRGLFGGLIDTDGRVSVANDKKKPQLLVTYSSTSLRLCREVSLLAWSLDIRNRVVFSKTTDAGNDAWLVTMNAVDVQKLVEAYPNTLAHKAKRQLILETEVYDELSGTMATRYDLVPITDSLIDVASKAISATDKQLKVSSNYSALRRAKGRGYITRRLALSLLSFVKDRTVLERHPDWRMFWHWATDHRVTWEPIESVERTQQVQVGFDITVPGYENWMNIDGVFCPNTSSIHVPITKGEIDNLRKRLMPSKMLLSPADFKSPMYAPNQDFMLGISLASIKRNKRRAPKVFMTQEDADRALERGDIDWHDPVKILEEK